jgi:TolA-binding protein
MKRNGIIGQALVLAALSAGMAFAQASATAEAPSRSVTVDEAGRLLATGRAALEDGLHDLASRRLEELVDGAPDRRRQAEGALWLARVRLAQARPAEALGLIDAHAPSARSATLQAEFELTRAQALMALERWTEAAGVLDDFRSRRTGHASAPAALRLLARARMALQEWAAARAVCAELESGHPDSPDTPAAWLDLAAALGGSDQPADARRILERIETAYAGQSWGERAALGLLEWHVTQGDRAQALRRLDTLATNRNLLAETRAHGFQIVARALAAETSYSAALDMIEKGIAAAADPAQRLDTQLAKARILIEAGRAEEGAALMRSLAAGIPDRARAARVQQDLAAQMARLEHWNEAAAECQVWLDAFEGEPGTAEILSNGGWALWKAGRPAEAAAWFERAAAAETGSDRRLDLRQKLADARFAAGQFSQARTVYDEVLAALPPGDPAAGRVQYQLAETELALGETEAGEIRLLDLSRAPGGSEHVRAATMRLGVLYEERGALESAVDQYSRLLDAGPDPAPAAEALLARGLVRFRMGSFQAALDDFSRIRDDFPQTPSAARAMFMRGWCLYLLGRDDEALRVCEQFLADYPHSEFVPDVHFWLGEHAFNHGDPEQAEKRFAQLAREHPGSPRAADALFWAGRAATARRAYLAANEHFNALMAQYPDSPRLPETLLAQGDVLSELGQFPAAILAFNEVIVRFPRSAEAMIAWGRKGDCQYTLGQDNSARYEEALLSYRTLLDFAGAPADLRLQAGFKVGRCLEKMGRAAAALDRYMETAYAYLQEDQPPPEATVWFTRSAFAAAALQERAGNWKEAAGIYRRVADSGVPAAAEARDRMDRIRRDHWVLF